MRGWIPVRKRSAQPAGPLLLQRFTVPARHVIRASQEEARGLGHGYVGTEHILLGLLSEGEGVAARALGSLGIGPTAARQQVEGIIGRGEHTHPGHRPLTPRAKKVLELALREAMRLDHLYVGTEHMLLGLIREGNGVAGQVLAKLGAGSDEVRGAVSRLLADDARKSLFGPFAGHELPPVEPLTPPGLRDYDEKIAEARKEKDAAIDAKDFDGAAALRESEKRLLAERERRIAEWSADLNVVAMSEELDRLRHQVARLTGLLLQHGISPGEAQPGPNRQTA